MRRDKTAVVRRARFLQAMFFQGALAVILLTFVLLSWGDAKGMALFGVTLLIPLGWGWAFWDAYRRDDGARREGRWSKDTDAAERKRVFGRLGAIFVVWLVLAGIVVVFLD